MTYPTEDEKLEECPYCNQEYPESEMQYSDVADTYWCSGCFEDAEQWWKDEEAMHAELSSPRQTGRI